MFHSCNPYRTISQRTSLFTDRGKLVLNSLTSRAVGDHPSPYRIQHALVWDIPTGCHCAYRGSSCSSLHGKTRVLDVCGLWQKRTIKTKLAETR
ncbi:hypothetical protein PILCRDRAFT_385029 [Piloderma croceum F 1598]|uniref:Uncharacterized protein n=1 Tax=Piloderma croceum (strain F 1598) TaxID=765440 RepID=A0A0C3FJ88_PILCF|nr:hypothetical protein PILCRDRAFT_385029 [Piloderma croceum F 1598]